MHFYLCMIIRVNSHFHLPYCTWRSRNMPMHTNLYSLAHTFLPPLFVACLQVQLSGMDDGTALANHIVQTLPPSIIHVVGYEAAKLGQIVRLAHEYSHFFPFRESAHTFVRSLPHLRLLCCIPGHWTGWLRPSTHRRGTPCSSSSAQKRLSPDTAFQTLASKYPSTTAPAIALPCIYWHILMYVWRSACIGLKACRSRQPFHPELGLGVAALAAATTFRRAIRRVRVV